MKETFIDGDKTILKTDYYLYLLQLDSNWNKLKEGLLSLYDFDEGVVSEDYLDCVQDTLDKMQELEGKDENWCWELCKSKGVYW